jgi:hypothetical protein
MPQRNLTEVPFYNILPVFLPMARVVNKGGGRPATDTYCFKWSGLPYGKSVKRGVADRALALIV